MNKNYTVDFCVAFVGGVVIAGSLALIAATVETSIKLASAAAPARLAAAPPVVEGVPPVAAEPEQPAPAARAALGRRVRQDRVLAFTGGLLLEALSNATPASTPGEAFMKQFMKQVGAQIQVAVLDDGGVIARDPALAFAQGFLIGL